MDVEGELSLGCHNARLCTERELVAHAVMATELPRHREKGVVAKVQLAGLSPAGGAAGNTRTFSTSSCILDLKSIISPTPPPPLPSPS